MRLNKLNKTKLENKNKKVWIRAAVKSARSE